MQDQDPNWLSGGGQAWERLRQDPTLRAAVNEDLQHLGMAYRPDLRIRAGWAEKHISDRDAQRALELEQEVSRNKWQDFSDSGTRFGNAERIEAGGKG